LSFVIVAFLQLVAVINYPFLSLFFSLSLPLSTLSTQGCVIPFFVFNESFYDRPVSPAHLRSSGPSKVGEKERERKRKEVAASQEEQKKSKQGHTKKSFSFFFKKEKKTLALSTS